MKTSNFLISGPLAMCLMLFGSPSHSQAQNPELNLNKKCFWLTKSGVALGGYNATTCFTGKPKEGKKQFAISHQGIVYRFFSQDNLDAFKANPNKFVPEYGGWCSYALIGIVYYFGN